MNICHIWYQKLIKDLILIHVLSIPPSIRRTHWEISCISLEWRTVLRLKIVILATGKKNVLECLRTKIFRKWLKVCWGLWRLWWSKMGRVKMGMGGWVKWGNFRGKIYTIKLKFVNSHMLRKLVRYKVLVTSNQKVTLKQISWNLNKC